MLNTRHGSNRHEHPLVPDLSGLSLLCYGIYDLALGLLLMFIAPGALPDIDEGSSNGTWVRLLGFALCAVGYFYVRAGIRGDRSFARLTVHTRIPAVLVMLALMMWGDVHHLILLYGTVASIGGLWTWGMLWLERPRSAEDEQ